MKLLQNFVIRYKIFSILVICIIVLNIKNNNQLFFLGLVFFWFGLPFLLFFPVIIFGLDVESIMDDNKWWILPTFCYHLIGNTLLRIWFTRQFAKGRKFPEWMRRDAGNNLLICFGITPTKKNTVILAITLIVLSLIPLFLVMND